MGKFPEVSNFNRSLLELNRLSATNHRFFPDIGLPFYFLAIGNKTMHRSRSFIWFLILTSARSSRSSSHVSTHKIDSL